MTRLVKSSLARLAAHHAALAPRRIADLFAAPAGDRGIAFSNAGGADLYVFVDANKDGNFTAADDLVIKLIGLGAAGLSEVDVNF